MENYLNIFESYVYPHGKLNEATIKDLVNLSTKERVEFSPRISEYIAFTFKSKNAYFKTGKYFQVLKFPDLSVISRLKGRDEDKIEAALNSDVKVHCTCPDFLYGGFKYMGTVMDYSIYSEKRRPDIRNPEEGGTVCKHLTYLLDNSAMFIKDLAGDVEVARRNKYHRIVHNKELFSEFKKIKLY